MRWKPEGDRCLECNFSWIIPPEEAVALVASSPSRVAAVMEDASGVTKEPCAGVWSPSSYLWHLVDVLRIGAERLLTSSIDPAAGIPCWDENALAKVRRYESLSPRVGLVVYREVVTGWVGVAGESDADAAVEHPEFGSLTAGDIMRRSAHEVQHHELDIRRGLRREPS